MSFPNLPPAIDPIADQRIDELTELTVPVTATDPDLPSEMLTFSLDPGAPPGSSVDAVTGVFKWIPTEAQGPGVYPITVRVTDSGSPNLSTNQTFKVTVNEVNSPPTLSRILPDQVIDELKTLTVNSPAIDSDIPANILTFSLGPGAPVGASINAATGLFSWTPSEAQGPGTNTITVFVTDSGSPPLRALRTFAVVVNEVNSPPTLTATVDQTIGEETTLASKLTATDPDIPANSLTFSLESGAPGMIVDPVTGLLTWTVGEITATQTNKVLVRVTDSGVPPLSDSKTLSIITTNSSLRLARIPYFSVDEGALVSFTAAVTNSPLAKPPFTFQLDPGKPDGALISPDSGSFLWQPGEAHGPSTNNIIVRVTDSSSPPLTARRSFSVIVREVNRAPVLDLISPQAVALGRTLSVAVHATDPDIPVNELRYSLEPGSLAGAAIDSKTGVFSWLAVGVAAPSSNSFTVRVSDNGAPLLSDTKSFQVTVMPPSLSLMASNVIDGVFRFTLNGERGRVYLIQTSVNLRDWEPLTNFVSAASLTDLLDPGASNSRQRFYRAVSP